MFIEIQDNPSLTEPNICKNPDTLNSTINKEDDKQKEKERKQIERKTQNLEEIIQSISLTSPMKYQIIHNVVKKNPKSLEQILEISNKEKDFEELVTECLITNLKQLNKEKKFPVFHETLQNIFGEHLEKQEFTEWLAGKLGIRHHRFVKYVAKWRENKFTETRGRQEQLEVKQKVYDMWLKNAINSTDGRNGRNMVRLSKRKFLQQYGAIKHSDIVIEEIKNKRGQTYYSANRMIATCTIRSIIEQLSNEGISVSYSTVISLRPFFVTHATEKEIALCLCKLCLNTRLLFEPLMTQAKKDNDKTTESITEFFMSSCECPRTANGYYQWSCVSLKCKNCKNLKPIPLKCEKLQTKVKVSQFEITKQVYTKILKNGESQQKTSEKTQRVEHFLSYEEIYKKLSACKKDYTCHKYQVFNDKFHWPRILATCEDIGVIYHMDYSENLSQQYKYEPQSSHFNKNQYSLHCTVKHTDNKNSPYEYIYHLSDEKKHDFAFTSMVVNHILQLHNPSDTIRLKSDNCSTQYKCKYVFNKWQELAKETSKTVVVYYGVSGHGKGLVDAMSGFGVKGPLRREVITSNFNYSNASDIHQFLSSKFHNDDKKHYYYLESEKIKQERENKIPLPISKCREKHMISFFPDGSIQAKVNICSCPECLKGKFVKCLFEAGKVYFTACSDDECSDLNSNEEIENDGLFCENENVTEENEIRADCVVDVVQPCSYVALYAPPEAFEMFYLCYVIESGIASEYMCDDYNHVIEEGMKYLKCNYLEKKSEKKGNIFYKKLEKTVYVLPAQVLYPFVSLKDDFSMSVADYQWLTDSI